MRLDIEAARARLDEVIAQVEAGETIELTRGGRPVARIVPVAHPLLGAMKGGFVLPGDLSDGDREIAQWFNAPKGDEW